MEKKMISGPNPGPKSAGGRCVFSRSSPQFAGWVSKLSPTRLRRMFQMRFKPEEGRAAYLQRTAHLIQSWFQQQRLPMLHHSVLKAIFKEGWREFWEPFPDGSRPQADLREERSTAWWETVQGMARM